MKKTVAILLAVLLMLGALAACGGANNAGNGGSTGGGTTGAEGTYTLKSFMGMDLAAYAKMLEIDTEEAAKSFMIELKAGGQAVFTTDGDPATLSWSQSGDKITLSGGGETMDLTLKGSELTMSLEGMELVLEKK